MEFFSTKKSIFLHISSMFKSIFFFCLRFNSVVVKGIKSIHLFFFNPLMCFFLWSFKFCRFCQFQYILVIPNNCCLHQLPYPKGDKIGHLGQPYLWIYVKIKIKKHFWKHKNSKITWRKRPQVVCNPRTKSFFIYSKHQI